MRPTARALNGSVTLACRRRLIIGDSRCRGIRMRTRNGHEPLIVQASATAAARQSYASAEGFPSALNDVAMHRSKFRQQSVLRTERHSLLAHCSLKVFNQRRQVGALNAHVLVRA